MEKTKEYYMTLDYPVQIERVAGGFCAFISVLKGCKAFGETPDKAYQEIEAVKEGFFEVFLQMGKPIPEPVVHLDVPYPVFQRLENLEELRPYVVY